MHLQILLCRNRFPLLSNGWLKRVIGLPKISLKTNVLTKSAIVVSDFQAFLRQNLDCALGLLFSLQIFWILCGKTLLTLKSPQRDVLSTSGETRTDSYIACTAILTSDTANLYLLHPELNFKPIYGHGCLRSLNNFAFHTYIMTRAHFWTLIRSSTNPQILICLNYTWIDLIRLCPLLPLLNSSSLLIFSSLSAASQQPPLHYRPALDPLGITVGPSWLGLSLWPPHPHLNSHRWGSWREEWRSGRVGTFLLLWFLYFFPKKENTEY